ESRTDGLLARKGRAGFIGRARPGSGLENLIRTDDLGRSGAKHNDRVAANAVEDVLHGERLEGVDLGLKGADFVDYILVSRGGGGEVRRDACRELPFQLRRVREWNELLFKLLKDSLNSIRGGAVIRRD